MELNNEMNKELINLDQELDQEMEEKYRQSKEDIRDSDIWLLNKPARTIFYQGLFASQTQIARYMGKQGFLATTGERVVSQYGADVIHQVFVGKELDEVILSSNKKKGWSWNWKQWLHSPFYNISRKENQWYGLKIVAQNSEETQESVMSHSINLNLVSIGQKNDVEEHLTKYQLLKECHPDDDIILYGVSRVAATTFNAMCLNHIHYDLSRVKLVVLEGCFDSVPSLLDQTKFWLKYLSLFQNWIPSQYDPNGINPLQLADKFPLQVPLVFITCQKDEIVPIANTYKLIQKVKEHGHQNIHLLVLQNSSHPRYLLDCPDDRMKYLSFIHEIYQTYSLPYCPQYLSQKVNEYRL